MVAIIRLFYQVFDWEVIYRNNSQDLTLELMLSDICSAIWLYQVLKSTFRQYNMTLILVWYLFHRIKYQERLKIKCDTDPDKGPAAKLFRSTLTARTEASDIMLFSVQLLFTNLICSFMAIAFLSGVSDPISSKNLLIYQVSLVTILNLPLIFSFCASWCLKN